ncbi:FtsW/RodA/SpoVE family cell cycle protein [Prosthecochloris sp. HL-130-GSB]|jgi:cell division protein FtsW|uniref:Probable peptidoglycan glycosyltransferase FtsW n=1 Tax=Prosthecochloris aestuarii TaxID=1102 RepID=A0A831SPI8_PROAE|nr:putative peptidoglycan glycosyltransferase FtsW [Prosthecochloris sp. HL-130-GSB]ARM31743.1 cell cycle protein [Prosthecochloris sp. HL-130-GSB]MBO8093486.1 cell division protein FtsW [Prosthecochloris sp.]HED31371.1 cell division protein FtsW [Prosthecochloris aestuarii]
MASHEVSVSPGIPPVGEAGQPTIINRNVAGKLLFFIVFLLMCIGVLVVYSSGAGWAEMKFSNPEYFLWRQIIFTGLGLGTVIAFSLVPYTLFRKSSKILLLGSVVLLILLLVLKGVGIIEGAARWLPLGPLNFQVSDFAKYALIFHFARFISEKQAVIRDLNLGYYPLLTMLLTVVVLIAVEPNFSTASLVATIGFIMMFLGGVRVRHLLVTAIPLVPAAAVFAIAQPYRVRRLVSFFLGGNEEHLSYQVYQALIGLGNGGLTGLGIGASKQRELFLPLSYNDFVFVVIGEEFGFIGAVVLLSLFAGLFVCGLVIAKHAPDTFSRFVAIGITSAIVLYAFINIAVASHLLPTTGVALPFISYGGTALLFNSLGIGILINISRNSRREEQRDVAHVGGES